MQLNIAELSHLVGRASTLEERRRHPAGQAQVVADDDCTVASEAAIAATNARLECWLQLSAAGDPAKFRQRLALDQLDEATARQLLADPLLKPEPAQAALLQAAWVQCLQEVLQAAADQIHNPLPSLSVYPALLTPKAPLPCQELLTPFVQVARRQLQQQSGSAYAELEPSAHTYLERTLLYWLSFLSGRTLELEFSIFRAPRLSALNRLLGGLHAEPSDDVYQAFVAYQRAGGLKTLFLEYAVLARLLCTFTLTWVEATAEFLHRLQADRPQLEATFAGGQALGQVRAAASHLSDPHNRGRTVIALSFASGVRLLYKPKDLRLDAAYASLLAWLGARDPALSLHTLQVLPRAGYGWVEFIEHRPCRDEAEARLYYRRAGMLLGLLYILECTDCHWENLVAHGACPVLIDLETLLHPRLQAEVAAARQDAYGLAQEIMRNSVLRVGLLPKWSFGIDGQSYDNSALAGVPNQSMDVIATRWKLANTDAMDLSVENAKTTPKPNLPVLNGQSLTVTDYAAELIDGYEHFCDFLLRHRAALLADDGPLAAFAGLPARFVFRSTKTYGDILRACLHPDLLRDGCDRSIQIDQISRYMQAEGRQHLWPVFRCEVAALEQMDVPFFTACTTDADLQLPDGALIPGCFAEPSLERVRNWVATLNAQVLEQQVSIIRGCLGARQVMTAHRERSDAPAEDGAPAAGPLPLETEDAVAAARSIAAEIEARAIVAGDGTMTWIALRYSVRAQRYQLQPIGYDLYDGSVGLALFFAACHCVTGDPHYRDTTANILLPIRRMLDSGAANGYAAHTLGIGGLNGLGSIVYALTRCATLLGDSSYLAAAQCTAALITPEAIQRDRQFDIVGGAAGALLALLALWRSSGDEMALAQAMQCAEHLLKQRSSDVGLRTWADHNGKRLCGFSHGAAGIAYALSELAAVTGDVRLRAAAQEAVLYLRSCFSPQAGNWPDLRDDPPSYHNITWCHGASGVGMGLLGMLGCSDDPLLPQELETAIATTLRAGFWSQDHLCCGSCGRIDLLLSAALALGRPELRRQALLHAAHMVQRAGRVGAYQLFANLPAGVYQPTFFQGTAGIGYELLRLAHPELLPSVLRLA